MKREGKTESVSTDKAQLQKKIAALKKSPYLVPAVMKPVNSKKKQSSKLPPIKKIKEGKTTTKDSPLNWKQNIAHQLDLKAGPDSNRSYGNVSRPNSAFRDLEPIQQRTSTAPELELSIESSVKEAGQLTPRSVAKLRKTGTLSPRSMGSMQQSSVSALDLLSESHRDMMKNGWAGSQASDVTSETSLEQLYTSMADPTRERGRASSDVSLGSDTMSSITLDRIDLSDGKEGLIKLDVVSERTGKVLVKALVQIDVPLYHVRLLLNRAFSKKLPKGYHFIGPSGKGVLRSQEKNIKVIDAATSYFEGCSIVTVIVRIPPPKQKKLPFDGPVNVEEAIKKEKSERDVMNHMAAAYQTGAFEVLTLIDARMQHYQLRIKDIFNQIDTNQNLEIDIHELRQAMRFLKLTLSDQQLFSLMAFLDSSGDGLIQIAELEKSVRHYRRFCALSATSPEKHLQQVIASTKPCSKAKGNQNQGLLKELIMMDTGMRRRQNLLRPLGYDSPCEPMEDINSVSEELNLVNAMYTSPPPKFGFQLAPTGPPDPTWLKITDEEIIDVLAFLGLLKEETYSTLKKIRSKIRERARFDSRDHFGRVAFRVISMLDMMEQGWAWIKHQRKTKHKDMDLHAPESVISQQELNDIVEFLDPNKCGIFYETLKKAFQVVVNTYSKEWATWILLCDKLEQQMSHPEEFLEVLFPPSPEGGKQKEISRKALKAAFAQIGMSSKQSKKLLESLQRIKSKAKDLNESQTLGSELHIAILSKALKKSQEMWEADNSVDLRLCLDLNRTPDILGVKAVKANMRKLYGRLKEKGLRLSDMFFPGGAKVIPGGALVIPHEDLIFGLQDMNDPPERVTAKAQSRQQQNERTQKEALERRKMKMEIKEKMKLLKELNLDQVVQKIGTRMRQLQKDFSSWFPEGTASTKSFHEICQKKLDLTSVSRYHCDQLAIFLSSTWSPNNSLDESEDGHLLDLSLFDELIRQHRKYQWEHESGRSANSMRRGSSTAPWTMYKSFSDVFVGTSMPKRHALSGIDFAAGLGRLREENKVFSLENKSLTPSPSQYELEDVAGIFFHRLHEYLDGDERNLALSLGAASSSSEVSIEDIRVWLKSLSWGSKKSGQSSPARRSSDNQTCGEREKLKNGPLFAEREVFLLIDMLEEIIGFEKQGAVTIGNLWKIIDKSVSHLTPCPEESWQERNPKDLPLDQTKKAPLFQSSASISDTDVAVPDALEKECPEKNTEDRKIFQKGKRFGKLLLLVSMICTSEEILIKGIDIGAGVSAEIGLTISGLEDIGIDVEEGIANKTLGKMILASLKFTISDIAGGQFSIDWGKITP